MGTGHTDFIFYHTDLWILKEQMQNDQGTAQNLFTLSPSPSFPGTPRGCSDTLPASIVQNEGREHGM